VRSAQTPEMMKVAAGLPAEGYPHDHLRRNFRLGVVSGIAFYLYTAVLSTELVMTWFMSELTGSNLLISLLIPIDVGSWYFLQLLLSGYVQRRPRILYVYRVMGYVRLGALALLSLTTFLLDDRRGLLILFLVLFTVTSVASGVAGLPFYNVVAKVVPPTRRGMFFGWRRFGGGLLALAGGALVRIILSPGSGLAFPDNYALLFFLGLLITIVLVASFSLVVEPAESVDTRRVGLGEQLRRALHLAREDRSYARYLGVRMTMTATSFALPFYAVYARTELSAPEEMVGVYLMGSALAGVLSNLIAGWIGDRYGNCLLLRLAAATAGLPAGLALAVAWLPPLGLETYELFALVFLFQGLHKTITFIAGSNYVLELAPSIERVLYVGFANGLVGLTLFATPLGGALADWLGFRPLFLFALLCGLAAVALALRLEEPRKTRIVAG
jgi:predicted MFS family arabinose efflux permease